MIHAETRDQLFISYSHRDQKWLDEFTIMLAPLQKAGSLTLWCDQNIKPGDNWKEEIEKSIGQAKIALLLVSSAFLASDFIHSSELPIILQSHTKAGLRIYWVLLEPCLIEQTPIYHLQAAHPINVSLTEITDLGERKKTITNICRAIAKELGQFSSVDRTSRLAFADKVQKSLESELEIVKEIDAGDFSFVYDGRQLRDNRGVAIKALFLSPLQSLSIENFDRDMQKARVLANRCFIEIFEVKLKEEPHIIVMERVHGPRLQDVLCRSGRLAPRRVARILYHIATALEEAHRAGISHGSLRPSNMFLLDGDAIKLPAVDLSNTILRCERMRGRIVTSYEMLTYMIPEIYEGRPVTDDEGAQLSEKRDQYYLGLLALEMLNGVPPVKINCLLDFKKKHEFFENPRAFFDLWRSEEPGLARIIARMLKKNPDERWPTMAKVAKMLVSVGDLGSWEDPIESLVKESYRQYCAGKDAFYRNFYRQLFRINPDTKRFFAKISMRRQYRMLDEAVALMTNFRVAPEPTALSRTARSHTNLGLTEKHYRDFSATFIETLKAAGEDDEDTLNAWHCLLRRGTEYMLGTHTH